MSKNTKSNTEYLFQFDATLSSSISSILETRKKSKEDASTEELVDDNIYRVRDKKFSRRLRRKLSEDEINDFLKIENRNKRPVYGLADFKRDVLSECP